MEKKKVKEVNWRRRNATNPVKENGPGGRNQSPRRKECDIKKKKKY